MTKLPVEPNVRAGGSFMFSLLDNLRSIIKAINQSADELATKAPIDSPTFTGDPKAPTPANSDNDTSIATTAWVNSAMATIATAAGFAFSFGSSGYVKLPSWLGGFIVQWGQFTTSASGFTNWTFPLAFPTALRAATAATVWSGAAPGGSIAPCFSMGSATTTSVPVAAAGVGIYNALVLVIVAVGN